MPKLTHEACRLLQDDRLVDRFNDVDQILEEAAAKLPRFAERDVIARVKQELADLADSMTRKRFSIGFIGPSQAGKSTTVGNLLSVSKDECPAPQGSGGPTTSVPTRLVPVAEPHPQCKSGERHLIELQYMTKAQFRDRVKDICRLCKLPYDDSPRALLEAAQKQTAEQPHFKAPDHGVLIGLLKAAIEFPDVIQETPKVEVGDFAKRRDYATHQEKPSKYTLLREVRIHFVTDAMSHDIDMIDLPGLGVDKESDDALTLAFLPQLDGAFMFQESHQMKSSTVSTLAEPMRDQHKNTLGGRVWMVVTKCDALNELQLNGPPEDQSQPSAFCHLNDTLKNQGLGGDAVIFVGNAYYVKLLALPRQPDGSLARPTPEIRTQFDTVLKFDEQDEPLVPERCRKYPGQVEPWRRFVLDGGLSNLRETMQSKVAESVRSQTRRAVGDKLTKVVENLIAALEIAEQQSGMSVEQMRAAAMWSGKLSGIAEAVANDGRFVQPLVDVVEKNMDSLLEGWGMPADRNLVANHANLARVLARAGNDEAGTQTKSVVAEIKKAIEEENGRQPPPDAPGLDTPLQHWARVSEDYIEPGRANGRQEFRQAAFAGLESDPSPFEGTGQQALSADDYLDIMRRKIRRVSQVYGSRLIHEVRGHIESLAHRYREVGNEGDRIDPGAKALYAEFRSRLTALR
ncbi:MAG: dynamin family protein [Planctomycetaceae bacterium]